MVRSGINKNRDLVGNTGCITEHGLRLTLFACTTFLNHDTASSLRFHIRFDFVVYVELACHPSLVPQCSFTEMWAMRVSRLEVSKPSWSPINGEDFNGSGHFTIVKEFTAAC